MIAIGEKILRFFKLQTSVNKEKTEKAECKMNSVTYVEMKSAKLENALRNFVVDERRRSNLTNYYVVTSVYFSNGFNMTLFEVDATQIKALVEATKDAKGKLEIKSTKSNMITLESNQNVAFGVGVAQLEYTLMTGEIKIKPLTFNDRPTLKLEETEESIPKVYLVNSDPENE